MIIAIDGFSSTGKSSFAKKIASKLGYIYIDTGALYRAVTLYALNNHLIDKEGNIEQQNLNRSLPDVKIEFRFSEQKNRSETYLNNLCVEEEIRGLEVSKMVSQISALPFVRDYVDNILRKIGSHRGVVMDGRDIGTVVFPDAEIKIFMTASEEVRAQRRVNEMRAKGENVNYEEILENVRQRDKLDQSRQTAPLVRAQDAYLLDNSDITIDQQMEWFEEILNRYETDN